MSSNENDDPAQIGMRIRGANGQTANLFVVEVYGGADKFVVDKDGDITATGDFALTGTYTHTGDLDVVGNLSVSVAATLPAITGPTTLTGTLGVTGAATLPAITGPTTLTGNLDITGEFFAKGAMPPGDYVVMLDGATYKAFSCRTGDLLSSSATYATVYAAALAALTSGNGVILDMTDGMGPGPTTNRYSDGVLYDPTFYVDQSFTPELDLISVFDGGAGVEWTGSGATDDTVNFRRGKKSIKTTSVNAVTSELIKLWNGDITDSDVFIRFYVDDIDNLASIVLSFSTGATGFGVIYTVWYYPVIGEKEGWVERTVSMRAPATQGAVDPTDVQAVRVRVTSTAGTTVNVSMDEIGMVKNRVRRGAIVMTFDDGDDDTNQGFNAYARPAMEKYGWKGVCFWNSNEANRQAEDIANMQAKAKAGWDIGAHTQTHPSMPPLTESEWANEVIVNLRWMAHHGVLSKWRTFAYPGGHLSVDLAEFLRKYFHICRGYSNDYIPFPDFNAMGMSAREVDTYSRAAMETVVGNIEASRRSMIFVWHKTAPGAAIWTNTEFETFLATIATKDVDVLTLSELIERHTTDTEQRFSKEQVVTITAGQTYVEVTHLLRRIPQKRDVAVIPLDNLGGRTCWPSDLALTTLRVTMSTMDTIDHSFKVKVEG